jgi:hypothetical protein
MDVNWGNLWFCSVIWVQSEVKVNHVLVLPSQIKLEKLKTLRDHRERIVAVEHGWVRKRGRAVSLCDNPRLLLQGFHVMLL